MTAVVGAPPCAQLPGSSGTSGLQSATAPVIPPHAFVTLLTTDSYLPGALVLAHSIRQHNKQRTSNSNSASQASQRSSTSSADQHDFHLVCLCTPAQLQVQTIKALRQAFDVVIGVEPLSFAGLLRDHAEREKRAAENSKGKGKAVSGDDAGQKRSRVRELAHKNLALLGRPELGEGRGAALSKLHAWRLTAYKRVVFLDADMLVLGDITDLFKETAPLSASPDTGWPDAFNSGLLSFTPSLEMFHRITEFAVEHGSWDGADQGLLNDFFGEALDGSDVNESGSGRAEWGSWQSTSSAERSDEPLASWSGPGWKRLSFRYNVTPNGGYTYAPAYQRYGKSILGAHFIGANKPWSQARPKQAASTSQKALNDYNTLLTRWHDVFDAHYGPALDKEVEAEESLFEVIHTERGVEVIERVRRKSTKKFVVPTYEAVWDSLSLTEDQGELQNGSSTKRQSGAGNVDDLKAMFSAGLRASERLQVWGGMEVFQDHLATELMRDRSRGRDGSAAVKEGIYFSMPIEGRLSLIPPPALAWIEEEDRQMRAEEEQKVVNREVQQQERPSVKPIDVPGAKSNDAEDDSPHFSPPQSAWNPAIEPPPATTGEDSYQMRKAMDTYYANVWDEDQNGKRTSGATSKEAFFRTRNVIDERIPKRLQQQGIFDNLGSDRPDPSRVKAVFPWEENQTHRRAPTRVFPDEPSFSSSAPSSNDRLAVPSETWSSSSRSSRMARPVSPVSTSREGSGMQRGLPANITFVNAWDEDPSIGAYAEHVKQRTRKISLAEMQARQADRGVSRDQWNAAAAPGAPGQSGRNISPSHHPRKPRSRPGSFIERDTSGEQEEEGDNESSHGEPGDDDDDETEEEQNRARAAIGFPHRRKSWRRQEPSAGYHRKAEAHGYRHPHSPRTSRFLKLDNNSQSSLSSSTGSRTKTRSSRVGDGSNDSSFASEAFQLGPHPASQDAGGPMLASTSPTFSRAELHQIQRTRVQAARASTHDHPGP